jgi:hypothetical protein
VDTNDGVNRSLREAGRAKPPRSERGRHNHPAPAAAATHRRAARRALALYLAPWRRGKRVARLMCRGFAPPVRMGAAANVPASRKPPPHNGVINQRRSAATLATAIAASRSVAGRQGVDGPNRGSHAVLRLIAVDRRLVRGTPGDRQTRAAVYRQDGSTLPESVIVAVEGAGGRA